MVTYSEPSVFVNSGGIDRKEAGRRERTRRKRMRRRRRRRNKKKRGRQESEGEQAWKNRHCLRQREEDREADWGTTPASDGKKAQNMPIAFITKGESKHFHIFISV